MYYQAESIKITSSDGTSEYIVNAQSLGISQKIERNQSMRLGKFRPQAYLGLQRHPITDVNIDYIPTGQFIETVLGLKGNTQVIDYLCNASYGKKNFEMKIYQRDLSQETSNKTTYTLESGVLTSYNFQAGVQQQPKVQIQAQFTDMLIDNVSSVIYPTYDEKTPSPRNYDIQFNVPTGILGVNNCISQQVQVSIPLQREYTYKIGSQKPYQRNIQAPVIAQVTLSAIVEVDDQITPTKIEKLKKGQWIDDVILITIEKPIEIGETPSTLMQIRVNKPYLENISWQSQVGQYRNVSITLQVPISYENGDELQNIKIY